MVSFISQQTTAEKIRKRSILRLGNVYGDQIRKKAMDLVEGTVRCGSSGGHRGV